MLVIDEVYIVGDGLYTIPKEEETICIKWYKNGKLEKI
jgi:hypothetical protein